MSFHWITASVVINFLLAGVPLGGFLAVGSAVAGVCAFGWLILFGFRSNDRPTLVAFAAALAVLLTRYRYGVHA